MPRRRRGLGTLVALLLALSVVGAACAGGGGEGVDPLALRLPEREADELRIAVGEDIWPLTGSGPTAKHFAAGELSVGVYEPLLSLGPDHTVRPGLAERWEQLADGSWRFHLRAGVIFHDGRPLTAADVVWSWTGRQLYPASVAAGLERGSVAAVDARTVDFRPAPVDNRLPEKLVHPEGAILAQGSHSDADPPMGTGPYRVVEYVPRQRVVVEAFDGYWGEPAGTRRLTFVFEPAAEARVAALVAGRVDVAANLGPGGPARERVATGSGSGLRLLLAPHGAVQSLTFNVGGARGSTLAADLAVRRAVSLALSRPAYVSEVLGGAGEAGRWLAPAGVLGPAADDVAPPVFDPAAAAAALSAAGWAPGPDGVRQKGAQRLTLTVIGGPSVPGAALEWVRTSLAGIGVEVVTKHALDVVTLNEHRGRGYDAEVGMANQNDANPAFLVGLRAAGELGSGRPDLAAAVDAARTAPARADAQRHAAAAMQILANDDVLVLPLATVARAHGVKTGVRIGELHPSAVNQRWATLAAPG